MKDLARGFRSSTLQGIRDVRDLAYAYAQLVVPVKTGRLKRSGYKFNLDDGAGFGWSAPYARVVDVGSPGGTEDVGPTHIREHWRRTSRSYTTTTNVPTRWTVRKTKTGLRFGISGEHTVTRTHGRVRVQAHDVRGYRRSMPPTRGRYYATRAVNLYLPTLGQAILARLKATFS